MKYLITGGTGYLGSAVACALHDRGDNVRVFGNNFRGVTYPLPEDVEVVQGDVRNYTEVYRAAHGCDSVLHFAFVNGTKYFYERPQLVLSVAILGIHNVVEACQTWDLPLVLVSSSEVYQEPGVYPTPEEVPYKIPDPHNPRYSYAAGKLVSEMYALHSKISDVRVVRPHNIYGPPFLSYEHVVPCFIKRLADEVITGIVHKDGGVEAVIPDSMWLKFSIQGTGFETRAFCYLDDFVSGFLTVLDNGRHREIYNIGTSEEVGIAGLAQLIAGNLGLVVQVVPGELPTGAPKRRCPDITKLFMLGYRPKIHLHEGIRRSVEWYLRNKVK